MNSKILRLNKGYNVVGTRVFNTFVSDKYGTWENYTSPVTNANAVAAISQNYMKGAFWGSFSQDHEGIATSSRTIPNLREAKSIAFTLNVTQGRTIGWTWSKSWDVRFRLLNSYVDITYTRTAFNLNVGGSLISALSASKTYSIVLYRDYLTLDGVKKPYAQDVCLKNASGNLCEAYCCAGKVWSNESSVTSMELRTSSITVSW